MNEDPRLPGKRLELSPPRAFGTSLLLTLLMASFGMLLQPIVRSTSLALLALGVFEVALYGGAAIWMVRAFVGGPLTSGLAMRTPALRLAPLLGLCGLSLALGVLAHVPAGFLDALIERRFPLPEERALQQIAALTPKSTLHAVSLVAVIVVAGPFAEEVFFRGAMFSALSRRAGVAITVTSLSFVLAHQEPRLWPPLLVVALLLAEVRRVSGSLWPGYALHAAFNATTLGTVFITRPTSVEPPQPSLLVGLGGAVATLSLLLLFTHGAELARKDAS